MANYALIVAGGSSRRMGGIDKQFIDLGGQPLIAHTLQAFEDCPVVDYIVVATRRESIERLQALVAGRFAKVRAIVEGGAERQDSCWAGLRAIQSFGDCEIVAIHDGARPFVSIELIKAAVEAAQRHGASVVAVPVKDTIKLGEGGFVEATPQRSRLWAAQTPQVLRFDLALKAFAKAYEDGFVGTDDAQLVERLGERVAIVEGAYENIKITTPEDLPLARDILLRRTAAK